eukprot:CAMPEP_0113846830 /NCGR_PEP_ID=MMETSP0372-20130328/1524_1 /TAXON_ID=340204 /ORGANISM="Lankesteria abbotti" /LENGTH=97 /DNA_ID=CAMNT_0000816015 /DNA_START=426 /DNA_END=719 /DNA_ORIENTATION=+ /assembly_acc=CAM_ASM_000359
MVFEFGDRYFVVISQLSGRIGSLIDCCVEDAESGVFGARVLLGDRSKTFLCVYGRAVMEHISKTKTDKPVLLGIAMKTEGPETFKRVMKEFTDHCTF